MRGHSHRGHLGQLLGQQGSLDVGDDAKLALDRLVRDIELFGENQILRGTSEQVRHPDSFGQILFVEAVRFVVRHDDHVLRLPLVKQWDRHK